MSKPQIIDFQKRPVDSAKDHTAKGNAAVDSAAPRKREPVQIRRQRLMRLFTRMHLIEEAKKHEN